eukprot:313126-Prymnesium_polylepis.1
MESSYIARVVRDVACVGPSLPRHAVPGVSLRFDPTHAHSHAHTAAARSPRLNPAGGAPPTVHSHADTAAPSANSTCSIRSTRLDGCGANGSVFELAEGGARPSEIARISDVKLAGELDGAERHLVVVEAPAQAVAAPPPEFGRAHASGAARGPQHGARGLSADPTNKLLPSSIARDSSLVET